MAVSSLVCSRLALTRELAQLTSGSGFSLKSFYHSLKPVHWVAEGRLRNGNTDNVSKETQDEGIAWWFLFFQQQFFQNIYCRKFINKYLKSETLSGVNWTNFNLPLLLQISLVFLSSNCINNLSGCILQFYFLAFVCFFFKIYKKPCYFST